MVEPTANRLKEIRESKDPRVEAYDIAAYLRVSVSTVSRWDGGKDIPTKHVGPLTAFLDVTADHLLGLDRQPLQSGKAA